MIYFICNFFKGCVDKIKSISLRREYQHSFLIPYLFTLFSKEIDNDIQPFVQLILAILILSMVALSNFIYILIYFNVSKILNKLNIIKKYPKILNYLHILEKTRITLIYINVVFVILMLFFIIVMCLIVLYPVFFC